MNDMDDAAATAAATVGSIVTSGGSSHPLDPPRGVKREEFVRVVLQALRDAGYRCVYTLFVTLLILSVC